MGPGCHQSVRTCLKIINGARLTERPRQRQVGNKGMEKRYLSICLRRTDASAAGSLQASFPPSLLPSSPSKRILIGAISEGSEIEEND